VSEAKPDRTRTFSWDDPMETAKAAREMSGLEFWRAVGDGRLPAPPFAVAIGVRFLEGEEGRIAFEIVPSEFHYNPIGVVHAGVALTMIDSAIGCAVHTMLPAGVGYTTLETKGNLVRALTIDTGPVRCEGRVIHFGSRSATGEARLTDAAGRLYAHGTSTCLILR